MNQLFEAFSDFIKLSPETADAFLATIIKKKVRKKTLVQESGGDCNYVYFIEKGIARTFYYKDGKDITYWIAAENEFIGSLGSFFSRTPGNKYVEVLEDSILWEFSHAKLEALYASSKEMERVGRLFAQYGISLLEKRIDDVHALSAKERYELLLAKHPQIIQRVPMGIIASYLGVTSETLSRIRAQT
jgi:CRP-like cAMP-binding protein